MDWLTDNWYQDKIPNQSFIWWPSAVCKDSKGFLKIKDSESALPWEILGGNFPHLKRFKSVLHLLQSLKTQLAAKCCRTSKPGSLKWHCCLPTANKDTDTVVAGEGEPGWGRRSKQQDATSRTLSTLDGQEIPSALFWLFVSVSAVILVSQPKQHSNKFNIHQNNCKTHAPLSIPSFVRRSFVPHQWYQNYEPCVHSHTLTCVCFVLSWNSIDKESPSVSVWRVKMGFWLLKS